MILTFSKAVIGWAMGKVTPLMRLRGSPEELEGQRRYAGSVLRIAHPQLVFLRCLDLGIEGDRLMDALRVSEKEIAELDNSTLKAALMEKRPPTSWIRNPNGEIPSVFVKAALRMLPTELEEIEVTASKIKPLDWLIDMASDSARFFPEPVELRKLFGKKLPCADGESEKEG